jgi:hypothetical protein
VVGAGSSPPPLAAGAELVPGDERHAAVQGQAPGERQRQPFPGVLAEGQGAAVRPVAAAQLHRNAGSRPSVTEEEEARSIVVTMEMTGREMCRDLK